MAKWAFGDKFILFGMQFIFGIKFRFLEGNFGYWEYGPKIFGRDIFRPKFGPSFTARDIGRVSGVQRRVIQ